MDYIEKIKEKEMKQNFKEVVNSELKFLSKFGYSNNKNSEFSNNVLLKLNIKSSKS